MKKEFSKKQWWFTALGLVILVVATASIFSFINRPQNIGSQLEYIGKRNTACEWWQVPLFLGWCRGPQYDYYFATDMSEEALKTYFKKSTLVDVLEGPKDVNSTYVFRDASGYDSSVELYFNKQAVDSSAILSKTEKKYILKVPEDSYAHLRAGF